MQDPQDPVAAEAPQATAAPRDGREATRLRDISPQQWRSGIAAWLGWLFDGLDMHLYTVVATPFVALLLTNELGRAIGEKDPLVGYYGSIIQASFLAGWALGGGFFGRIGDRIGRARALSLTILTYACFTGLSFFAQTWWQLMICRFLAALGIGGEWAVGATLLSETWPRRWRPWIAATLQSAVNIGVMLAMVATYVMAALPKRYVFLVGILPALLVFWIRRAVPEPEEWHAARDHAVRVQPRIRDLFRGEVRRTTVLTILVCALSLSAHWVFMYWFAQHIRNHPDLSGWQDSEKQQFASVAMVLVMVASVCGNFVAGGIAKWLGYRRSIAWMCLCYFVAMFLTYRAELGYSVLLWCLGAIGICQGLFGLFTMYLPPLFPTLLRTTGAGFCYNIGRLVAAGGTIFFGMLSAVHLTSSASDLAVRSGVAVSGIMSSALAAPGTHSEPAMLAAAADCAACAAVPATSFDCRFALLYASFVFLPAAAVALLLPEPPDESRSGDGAG